MKHYEIKSCDINFYKSQSKQQNQTNQLYKSTAIIKNKFTLIILQFCMDQQINHCPNLLFKIDVKVGDRIITLNVNESDTIEGLLIRHKMGDQANVEKFNSLKDKIKTNIQKQMEIKSYSSQVELADKMREFLLKENQVSCAQTQPKEFQRTQNRLNQGSFNPETPFNFLLEKTLTQVREKMLQSPFFEENKISDPNSHKNQQSHQKSVLKEVSVTKNHIKPQISKGSASIKSKSKKMNQKENSSYKKPVQSKVDEDLIKAYEVIWKKSKDKTMREMAQNTLRELNVLPEQNKINEFVPIQNKQEHKNHINSMENDESIKTLTPIEKNEPGMIFNERSIRNDPFSESRSFMRRNYRYSYLEENSNLHYPYERAQKSKEKYAYNRFDQTYINILNKDYDQKSYQKIHLEGPVNRRYNYLDD